MIYHTGETHFSARHPERILRGEQSGMSKLSDEKVKEIRILFHEKKFSQYAIAAMFGVSRPTIGAVIKKETWVHVL